MSASGLVLPDHLKKRPTKGKVAEEMLNAVAGVAAQIAENASAHVVQEALGPLAKLFGEFMERQAALEDSIWYCGVCRTAKFVQRAPESPLTCTVCPVADGGQAPLLIQYAYVPKAKPLAPEHAMEVIREADGGDVEC